MTRLTPTRSAFLAAGAAALLVGSLRGGVDAQSEFLGGEGMPYGAFDRLPKTDIPVQGGVVHVGFAPGVLALPRPVIFDWIRRAAKAVTTYYGRFPVDSLRLLIVPVSGSGVRGGTTWGYRGGAIRMLLGRDADEDDLKRDWMMTHEMVHLALPDMSSRYNWLSEGLAVYIEPIARVQAGELAPETIWTDMVRDMPTGEPGRGDGGLDGSENWARTYWGGALFCLRADVEIRRRTKNRLGLQDAMRGVLAAGGNHEVDWPIRRILGVADHAIEENVLTDQYEAMHAQPVTVDLTGLWRDLGIRPGNGGVRFDDTAPDAAIRTALTAPRAS